MMLMAMVAGIGLIHLAENNHRVETIVDEHNVKTGYIVTMYTAARERSINLSGQSVSDSHFLDYRVSLISETDIPKETLRFEITETSAITNLGKAQRLITELQSIGCSFALDDFGSGISSFAYLKNLPADFLKIDGSLVKDIAIDPIDQAMVRSINEIGHVMGKKTIAEFVENDEILHVLQDIGVDYAQGFGIHKPVPLDKFIASITGT